jgi:hypothetical protein
MPPQNHIHKIPTMNTPLPQGRATHKSTHAQPHPMPLFCTTYQPPPPPCTLTLNASAVSLRQCSFCSGAQFSASLFKLSRTYSTAHSTHTHTQHTHTHTHTLLSVCTMVMHPILAMSCFMDDAASFNGECPTHTQPQPLKGELWPLSISLMSCALRLQ